MKKWLILSLNYEDNLHSLKKSIVRFKIIRRSFVKVDRNVYSFFPAIGHSYLHNLSNTFLNRLKLLWGEIACQKLYPKNSIWQIPLAMGLKMKKWLILSLNYEDNLHSLKKSIVRFKIIRRSFVKVDRNVYSFFPAIGHSYLHNLSNTFLNRLKLLWGEIACQKLSVFYR